MKSLVKNLGFTHFETVENPVTHVSNPSVFIKSEVAIALKHPIIPINPVKVPNFPTKELPVEKEVLSLAVPQ
ncbi:hypothetical protein [Bacillus toyonensis]|uniref:hypothetical protein n=1 Tax=Bacillus toyonensis TaxID=155322 RepID=UPI00211D4A10|nr:hypothetical protein [Bacillus toyonensis]